MYLVTSIAFFVSGGVLALITPVKLARPGTHVPVAEVVQPVVTMHGTIMLLLFATPLVFAFANLVFAAADQLPERRVPTIERPVVLALPVRWATCARSPTAPATTGAQEINHADPKPAIPTTPGAGPRPANVRFVL